MPRDSPNWLASALNSAANDGLDGLLNFQAGLSLANRSKSRAHRARSLSHSAIALTYVIAEVKRLHALGLAADAAAAQANWGPYADWFLLEQQAPIAVRKVYEEIEGKLPPPR